MGQKGVEKWAVVVGLQPLYRKSDSLQVLDQKPEFPNEEAAIAQTKIFRKLSFGKKSCVSAGICRDFGLKIGLTVQEVTGTVQNFSKLQMARTDAYVMQDFPVDLMIEQKALMGVQKIPQPVSPKDYFLPFLQRFFNTFAADACRLRERIGKNQKKSYQQVIDPKPSLNVKQRPQPARMACRRADFSRPWRVETRPTQGTHVSCFGVSLVNMWVFRSIVTGHSGLS